MMRAFSYTHFSNQHSRKAMCDEEKEIDGEAQIGTVLDVRKVLYVHDVFRRRS